MESIRLRGDYPRLVPSQRFANACEYLTNSHIFNIGKNVIRNTFTSYSLPFDARSLFLTRHDFRDALRSTGSPESARRPPQVPAIVDKAHTPHKSRCLGRDAPPATHPAVGPGPRRRFLSGTCNPDPTSP